MKPKICPCGKPVYRNHACADCYQKEQQNKTAKHRPVNFWKKNADAKYFDHLYKVNTRVLTQGATNASHRTLSAYQTQPRTACPTSKPATS